MFKMSFVLKEKKDGTLNLVLPIWFRVLFLFIGVLLAAGIIVNGLGTGGEWIPILIMIACIAGALYEEKWIFNKQNGKIEYISGLLFINKKTAYEFKDAEIFKISGEFHKDNEGKLNRIRKKMVKLSLILKSDQVLDIDISTAKTDGIELKNKAGRIASYCDIQLTVDSNQ